MTDTPLGHDSKGMRPAGGGHRHTGFLAAERSRGEFRHDARGALEPRAPASIAVAVDRAARVLDIGRSFDVLNRHVHVADILLTTDLNGFAHDELALLSAIVRRAGDRHADLSSLAFVRESHDQGLLDRAAVILSLADEIEARCRRGRSIAVACEIGRSVTISVPLLRSWLAKDLDKRFERAFGRRLVVRPGS